MLQIEGLHQLKSLPSVSDPLAPRSLVAYAALNFVAGCYRSQHNHFYDANEGKMVSIDNDRWARDRVSTVCST